MDAYEEFEGYKSQLREKVRALVDEIRSDNPGASPRDIEDELNDKGSIFEVADCATPIHNSTIMRLASLSEVYNTVSEVGPAFDGSPTPLNIAAGAIFSILEERAWEEVWEYLQELEEDDEEDER